MKSFSLLVILISLTACVEHRGRISLDKTPDQIPVHVYKNGMRQDTANPLLYHSPMPGEMHLDAWYRDAEGYFYRAHRRLRSLRPWWQRFPFDLGTDALWPGTLVVETSEMARFQRNERLTKHYLDEMAAVHRLKIEK